MKKLTNSTKLQEIRSRIAQNNITDNIYAKLLNGGTLIEIHNKGEITFEKVYNVTPDGILCNDLETFLPWELFK